MKTLLFLFFIATITSAKANFNIASHLQQSVKTNITQKKNAFPAFTTVNASKAEKGIIINWSIDNLIDTYLFEIQKLGEDSTYQSIGIFMSGTTDENITAYKFVDAKPTEGNNVYRIKHISENGQYIYSKTVNSLFVKAVQNKLSVYPSPATNNIIVDYKSDVRNTYFLYNFSGQLLETKQQTYYNQYLSWNISHLKPGIYTIKTDKFITTSFVKK